MTDIKLKLNSKNRFKVESCPCGKSNKDGKFVPFDNCVKFGYCHSCCEKFLPNIQSKSDFVYSFPERKKETIQFIPSHFVSKSLKKNQVNNLVSFLNQQFGNEVADGLVESYKIGSSKQWNGANVFWYIDSNNNVRTGKIMLYDKQYGKRIKEPYNHITWVHNKLNILKENISTCLFGEHLLNIYPNKPIAVVESEKTAIIASVYFPNFIWMAAGGIGNLSYEKIKALKGRGIVLFPDLGAYNQWFEKVKYFKTWFNIMISDYLEKNATTQDKEEKYDLADYLLPFNKNHFFGID
jgi:hypothetical protein